MDGISTKIALFDSLTGPAMRMVSALDNLTSGFRTVEETSRNAGDAASFDDMRQSVDLSAAAVDRLNSTFDRIDNAIDQNAQEQSNFNNQLQQSGGFADALLGKLGQVAGLVGAAFGAKAVVDIFKDSVDQANGRIVAEQQLVNVLANQGAKYEDFVALKKEAAAIQDRSMYSDTSMVGAAAELATYIKDADALKTTMGTLANYAAGMSGGAKVSYQQMVEYATQLGKALDGTYDGLKKKGFELTDAQKKIIDNGSDMEKALVIDAVINQSWAGLAEQMAQTPQGMMESLANEFSGIQESIGAQMMPAVMGFFQMIQDNMPFIEQVMQGIASGFNYVLPIITGGLNNVIQWIKLMIDNAKAAYEFIVNNWSQIAPVVNIIATALAAVVAVFIAYEAAVGIASVAQAIFNASLWACPLTWIVIAVVAIVLAIFYLVDAFNKASGESVSATGIIFGAFSVLGAFLWNLFLGLLELVLGVIEYMINPFVEFANFLANVFQNPVSSIIYLFQGMADTILALLQKIASALDFIFGSNMAATVEGWRSGLKAKADALVAEYAPDENYQKVFNSLDLSVEGLGLSRWAYGDAWETGYAAGESFDATIGDLFNTDVPAGFEQQTPATIDSYVNTSPFDSAGGGHAADIAGNTGRTAGNTSRMAEISEDNLKYLRDIAERDTINRFTTAEIRVDFGGINNTVNSELDLDGIVDYIAENVEETLLAVAEGVHA